MINVGTEQVASLMVGDTGIKAAAVGPETVFTRPGGYIYITLDTSDNAEKEN